MSKILIVHTSWYEENINRMIHISSETLKENDYLFDATVAPGAIELAALAKHKLLINEGGYVGVIFLGIVIRGGTSHYDLVSNETFRSIGDLAMNFPKIAFINNVICVENLNQLEDRIEVNTLNNTNALINLINEKSS
jgi:6,7-dimethyl-8-ribityllumazine synthase